MLRLAALAATITDIVAAGAATITSTAYGRCVHHGGGEGMSHTKIMCIALGLVALALMPVQALARKAPPSERAPGWYQRNGITPIKCVERSYSISVGNPAFKHRRWPEPCF